MDFKEPSTKSSWGVDFGISFPTALSPNFTNLEIVPKKRDKLSYFKSFT